MAKINITVEMTEKEYEDYKAIRNGDYLEKEVAKMDLNKILELKRFIKVDTQKFNYAGSVEIRHMATFKNHLNQKFTIIVEE